MANHGVACRVGRKPRGVRLTYVLKRNSKMLVPFRARSSINSPHWLSPETALTHPTEKINLNESKSNRIFTCGGNKTRHCLVGANKMKQSDRSMDRISKGLGTRTGTRQSNRRRGEEARAHTEIAILAPVRFYRRIAALMH